MPMKLGPETIEHIKVAEWVKQTTDLPFIHIANERETTYQNGRILKRMGVTAGVLDFFFPRGNHQFKALWLEMKSKSGKVSEAQAKFACNMVNEGYCVQIAYSADEAIIMLKSFYGIK